MAEDPNQIQPQIDLGAPANEERLGELVTEMADFGPDVQCALGLLFNHPRLEWAKGPMLTAVLDELGKNETGAKKEGQEL